MSTPPDLAEMVTLQYSNEGSVLIQAARRAFTRAARAAVEENDRLGITTHGGKDGKVVERQPKPLFKAASG